MAITNKNYIHDEFNIILNLVNAYYNSVRNILFYHHLSRNPRLKYTKLYKSFYTGERPFEIKRKLKILIQDSHLLHLISGKATAHSKGMTTTQNEIM
jgi:hypothetical protein